jgi:hypothetical protein
VKLRTNLRRFYVLALLILGTPTFHSFIIGSAVLILGQLIHFISAGYLVKRDELITAGPYKYVRHPFYIGSFTSDIGLSIMALNPYVPLIYFPLFYLVVIPKRVGMEEQFLLSKFGPIYEAYREKVPRYLPSWKTRLRESNGRFSWSQIYEKKEIQRVLTAFCLIILFHFRVETFKYGHCIKCYLSNPLNPFLLGLLICLFTAYLILEKMKNAKGR